MFPWTFLGRLVLHYLLTSGATSPPLTVDKWTTGLPLSVDKWTTSPPFSVYKWMRQERENACARVLEKVSVLEREREREIERGER